MRGVSTLHQPTQIAGSVSGVIILSIDLKDSVLHCINETAYSGMITFSIMIQRFIEFPRTEAL